MGSVVAGLIYRVFAFSVKYAYLEPDSYDSMTLVPSIRKLFSSAKTMRDLFRELDSRKTLQIIPYLEKEEVGCGLRKWFFTKMK